MNRIPLFVMLMLFGVAGVAATPKTIADFGGESFLNLPNVQLARPRRDAYIHNHFPIHTPGMTPGKIRGGELALPHDTAKLHPSFFVIGYDKYSVHWANANKTQLLDVSAKGFVVNVESAAQLEQLRSILKPLSLIAVSGSSFIELWGVEHYPFFVHQGAITQ
ncbi:PFL_4695 family integrating conjugative element protein [Gilvimarinus polysaccharolyticus]|uniref:PFL_4695 family integrating conjugative element protein n=1 Tax=Gilvimarinus polysaccharolyticus TaxID=863921 RepID=UPI00067381B9|nr:integrating conjugative element protein [Gilvimarinus polysaccharolyticus]